VRDYLILALAGIVVSTWIGAMIAVAAKALGAP
jgi:hypothetical protein